MIGGQAKILNNNDITRLLMFAKHSRHPLRNKVIVLLSVRAGLRASEIALLDWSMVTDARGRVGNVIELPGRITKYSMRRRLPVHSELKAALMALGRETGTVGPVVVSERIGAAAMGAGVADCLGQHMTPKSIVNWFMTACRETGLAGCSSHSGRRTFVTKAARLIHKAGGSLRDVQQLAGHRSIETTQAYIDGDRDIQRRLVKLM